jgi:hypothetical protein
MILTPAVMFLNLKQLQDYKKVFCKYNIENLIDVLVSFVIFYSYTYMSYFYLKIKLFWPGSENIMCSIRMNTQKRSPLNDDYYFLFIEKFSLNILLLVQK